MINYGRQYIDSDDVKAVLRVLKSDWLTQGPQIQKFENSLKAYFNSNYCTVLSSGTAALHLAVLTLGWNKEDIIITTPISFLATSNCILYCGATPSFVDIESKYFTIDVEKLEQKIMLIGCGTAYHSCITAKYWFEEFTNIPIEIDIASEFRYRKIKINKKNLYVFVSQSGETADTFAALDLCKKNNAKTCSIVNVVESSIARTSDFVLPIHAGPEIGVASTKAFIGQMLVLYLLVLKMSEVRKEISKTDYVKKISELKKLPSLIKDVLKCQDQVQVIAKDFLQAKGAMFLGRGLSYPIALEGALKLKELSYLHAEGYPAGEMKHGPLALIEEGLPVVVLAPKDKYFEKTISNMQEVIARGGKVILITNESTNIISENVRFTLEIPKTDDYLTPFLMTIPLQLLAYHVASLKNCDIDKPRNLAKSVTVE